MWKLNTNYQRKKVRVYKEAFLFSIKDNQLDYLLNRIVSFSVRRGKDCDLITIQTHQSDQLIGKGGNLIGKIARHVSKIIDKKIKIIIEPSKLWEE